MSGKYGSNLMKKKEKKQSTFGGPGEAYVESRGTKVSWRPHHTREQGKTIMTI